MGRAGSRPAASEVWSLGPRPGRTGDLLARTPAAPPARPHEVLRGGGAAATLKSWFNEHPAGSDAHSRLRSAGLGTGNINAMAKRRIKSPSPHGVDTPVCVVRGDRKHVIDYIDFQIVLGSMKKKVCVQDSDGGLI